MKVLKNPSVIMAILLSLFFSITCFAIADIDKSIHGKLGPNGKYLTLSNDFFVPHIPYTIICKLKNKSDETAYANAGPSATKELVWKQILINGNKNKNFEGIINLKPHSTTIIKVTGFELNGYVTQVFFSVQNLGYRFNNNVPIDVSCTTTIE